MTRDVRAAGADPDVRVRILDAACEVIALDGIDGIREEGIAAVARVSADEVRHHFATRDTLVAHALERSFDLVGDLRVPDPDADGWTAGERLGWMIDACLPYPGIAERDWRLWVELWLAATRRPQLRPVAARLYERYHAWLAATIREGVGTGEFADVHVDAVADRLIALLDGMGLRALLQDPAMDLELARREIVVATAGELGVPAEILSVGAPGR